MNVLSATGARLRAVALSVALCLSISTSSAAPCTKTSAQRDTWVAHAVNELVRAARLAYENDDRREPYERVIDRIAATMNQCRLTDDRDFADRYPEFVEYVKLLSLARKDDHELGF